MNEKQFELIKVVMDMIDGTLNSMKEDEFFAPADWILENWWATLNAALVISSSSLFEETLIRKGSPEEASTLDDSTTA